MLRGMVPASTLPVDSPVELSPSSGRNSLGSRSRCLHALRCRKRHIFFARQTIEKTAKKVGHRLDFQQKGIMPPCADEYRDK